MNMAVNERWTKDVIKEKVKVLKDNEVYRVADVICFNQDHKVVKEILKKKKKYKNTLLYKFFKNRKKYNSFYDCLVEEKLNLEYYDDEDVVLIHIRTGDDLNERGLTTLNIITLLKQLKNKYEGKNVVICTAMHYGHHRTSNRLYDGKNWIYNDDNYKKNIDKIHYFISRLNNPLVDIISNEDIDTDLCHLVFCKNLVASETCGGFARCVIEWHNRYYNIKD